MLTIAALAHWRSDHFRHEALTARPTPGCLPVKAASDNRCHECDSRLRTVLESPANIGQAVLAEQGVELAAPPENSRMRAYSELRLGRRVSACGSTEPHVENGHDDHVEGSRAQKPEHDHHRHRCLNLAAWFSG